LYRYSKSEIWQNRFKLTWLHSHLIYLYLIISHTSTRLRNGTADFIPDAMSKSQRYLWKLCPSKTKKVILKNRDFLKMLVDTCNRNKWGYCLSYKIDDHWRCQGYRCEKHGSFINDGGGVTHSFNTVYT